MVSHSRIMILVLSSTHSISAFVLRPQKSAYRRTLRTAVGAVPGSNTKRNNYEVDKNGQQRKRKSPCDKPTIEKNVILPEPEVIFSNNLLLVVNKPAGYHSQPNESIEQATSKKCLLSKLKAIELGGGSTNNFLLPMHRLDQPCTGVLLLAKNSKAGTRIGNAFRKHQIEKDYYVVVEGQMASMKGRSEMVEANNRRMYRLRGELMPKKGHSLKGGKSVKFEAIKFGENLDNKDGRICELDWEPILTISDNQHLLRVVTSTGAKHQVRAMMAQLNKSPICGDLRYGARVALPDASVALHARSLRLPTVHFGEMDMRNTRFVAPIPKTWSKFFNLTDDKIHKSVTSAKS